MSFDVDLSSFQADLRRLSRLNGKAQSENMLSFARTTMTNRERTGLLDVTPPASPGVYGTAAKRQGERAIERDLSRVFVGVRLKRKRQEAHPDVAGIHARLFQNKKPGQKLRSDRGKYYVDRTKLRALMLALKKRVGRLAAAWLVAARRLNVRGPAWIERHGPQRGSITVNLTAPRYEILMTAEAGTNAPSVELQRRADVAVRFAGNRVRRAITGTLEAMARKSGFKVAA